MTFDNWQDWAVALVVLFCIIRVGMSIFFSVKKSLQGDSPCASCGNVCDIKRLYDKKQQSCSGKTKKTKNSCCK